MEDMRNMILSEIIDKMHSRMADKMFPDEIKPMDAQDEKAMPPTTVSEVTDVEPTDPSGEPTDAELDEMLEQ